MMTHVGMFEEAFKEATIKKLKKKNCRVGEN